ncbi:MAG: hypothetical protein Q8P73_01815 [bacterium]|nr:hypothetical protein [bacterium]
MERPGRRFLVSVLLKHISVLLGVGVLLLAAAVIFSRPAKADPHAVFYTAVGQQQLFFNVLAALDQADYVEPATQGESSRQKLLEKRSEAGFKPETQSIAKSTETQLSNILTRSITLEGQDQWTSYMQFQLALEVARRNSLNELARKFCQHGLGILGCDPSKVENRQQDKAIVQDYIGEPSRALFERGVQAAFSSGTEEDQAVRKDIIEDKNAPKEYYAYNRALAALRKNIGDDNNKQLFVNNLLQGAKLELLPASVDVGGLDDINFDDNGDPVLAFAPPGSGGLGTAYAANEVDGDTFSQLYLGKIASLLSMPTQVMSIGMEAADTAASSLAADADGFKADRYYNPITNEDDTIEDIHANVAIPAEARKAEMNAIKNLPGMAEANQAFAPAKAEANPGQTEFVDRQGGQVQGVTSTNQVVDEQFLAEVEAIQKQLESGEVPQGEVKGILDWLISLIEAAFKKYDQPKQPISPNANPIAAHDEEGLRAALTATDPSFNPKEAASDVTGAGDIDYLIDLFCQILPFCSG